MKKKKQQKKKDVNRKFPKPVKKKQVVIQTLARPLRKNCLCEKRGAGRVLEH